MNREKFILWLHTNKMIRLFAFPIEVIHRNLLYWRYKRSEDSRYIKSLHNIHKGQRCFVIGNGPSLVPEDLEKLKGEVTFASNRIYHIYPYTTWRPTYYISIDNVGLAVEIERIKTSGNYIKFINYKGKRFGRKKEDNIKYVYWKGKYSTNTNILTEHTLSEDVSDHITQLGTVTANAIEMAIYMGFKEIYLLGVDNNYAVKKDASGKVYKDPSMKSSYFKGMRDAQGDLGDGISVQSVQRMNESYNICKTFADEHNVYIYNATRGGALETFKRVDFDALTFMGSHI